MDLRIFYDELREGGLNLTTENVAGTDFLLEKIAGADLSVNEAAYYLATAWHETGQRMQPIDEYGGASYFNKRYGPQTRVGRRLGNVKAGDGARYHGRGYVQLTGRDNYERAMERFNIDFINHPDAAKEPNNAWLIMHTGMQDGWFTTRAINDYIDDIDESDEEDLEEYKAARRVINGMDRASSIAGLALKFEYALKAAGYGGNEPQEEPEEPEERGRSLFTELARLIARLIGRLFSR